MNIFTKFDRLGCQISPVCVGSGVKFNRLDFLTGQIFYQPPVPDLLSFLAVAMAGPVVFTFSIAGHTKPSSKAGGKTNTSLCGPFPMKEKAQIQIIAAHRPWQQNLKSKT
jgi:hypothetical protein